ncbi:MAG: enoyl-CoA hydratase-related protein [Pseudomonadota bacterium]
MSESKIQKEPFLDGQALRIVLNTPKANILDAAMMGEINATLDELKEQKDIKLLCFTGAGDHFSFGASVPEHVKDKVAGMLELFHGMFIRIADLAIPTVAAVRGQCLGGGMELAVFCNRVVAHPLAVFGQPEIQLAVLPPIASLILPFKVGQSQADDINLTGRPIKADEGKGMGFVDQIADDPTSAIDEWAKRQIAPKSASSLRWAVLASRWRINQVLRSEIKGMEKLYLEGLMSTHDAQEGLAAFLEKRKPKWTNS